MNNQPDQQHNATTDWQTFGGMEHKTIGTYTFRIKVVESYSGYSPGKQSVHLELFMTNGWVELQSHQFCRQVHAETHEYFDYDGKTLGCSSSRNIHQDSRDAAFRKMRDYAAFLVENKLRISARAVTL